VVPMLAPRYGIARQSEDTIPDYLKGASLEGFVNVGICGPSGAGKSSFVNALTCRAPGDADAARVGCTGCTLQPAAYSFDCQLWPGVDAPPEGSRQIRIWDLPGAGTEHYPQSSYSRDLGLCFFDIVVIVCTRRITDVVLNLEGELKYLHRPHFVVRTQVDRDVLNEADDHSRSEADTLQALREDLVRHDIRFGFLLSSRRPDKFDFRRLVANLLAWIKMNTRDNALEKIKHARLEVVCPICGELLQDLSNACLNCDAAVCVDCATRLGPMPARAPCPVCNKAMDISPTWSWLWWLWWW